MAADGRPPGGKPALTVWCQALGLLALEGLSVGLFAALVLLRSRLVAYVGQNQLSSPARNGLLLCMVAGASVFCAAGAVYAWRHRVVGPAALRQWSLRLLPVLLLWLFPLLLSRWLWVGRDLTFLTLASLLGLGGYAALRTAWAQPAPGRRDSGRRWRWAHPPAPSWLPARPLALVGLAAAGYAVFFSYHTVTHHWNLLSTSFDLGIFDNLMWNIVHGGPFRSSPVMGPAGSHLTRPATFLAYHATFLAYVVAPLYALVPRAETLLVIQAALMGGAAVPLFLLARRHVGEGAAGVLALVYLFYPPLHGANLYDFHFLSVAPGFVWTSLYLLERRWDRLAVVAVLLTLLIREDVAAGMVIAGAYLVLSGERPRAGLVVAAAAALYFGIVKFIVIPAAGSEVSFLNVYQALVPAGEGGFLGVLKTVTGNPAYTVTTLLRADKLVYVLQLFAPLTFLPLRRPIGLLLLVPGCTFTLLATDAPALVQISFQYTAHWTAFLFVGTVLSLAWLGEQRGPEDTGGRSRQRAALVALGAAMLVCSYQYGALLQQGTARGGFHPYHFGTTSADLERRAAFRQIVRLIPPGARVAATESLVPQVSNRPDAYTLRIGTFDAEYLLFPVSRKALIWPDEGEPLVRLLETGQFGVMAIVPPFALAHRGFPATDNAEVVWRLAR